MSWAKTAVASFLLGTVVLFAAILLGPSLLPPTATETQAKISNLTLIISAFGVAIGFFVFALLVAVVVKFRAGPGRPDRRDARPKTHDRRLEAIWTIIPVLILVTITILSTAVLYEIDRPPAQGADFEVRVVGRQWYWTFVYPDGSSTQRTLYIEEGRVIHLNVTSLDVIHAFYVPAFGIKMDAVPGRFNHQWIVNATLGTYRGQCAEYCGDAHSGMLIDVVVFPRGSQPLMWGPPPRPPEGTRVDVELTDTAITPASLQADLLETLLLRVWNNGTAVHDLRLGGAYDYSQAPWNAATPALAPGEWAWLNVSVDWTETVTFYSGQGNDRTAGLEGTIALTTDLSKVVDLELWDDGSAFDIRPDTERVAKGETMYFRVWNNGSSGHNLYLGDPLDARIEEQWSREGSVRNWRWLAVETGDDDVSVSYWCNVGTHRALGMEGTLTVGRGGPVGQEASLTWVWVAALAALAGLGLLLWYFTWTLKFRSFDDPPKDHGPAA